MKWIAIVAYLIAVYSLPCIPPSGGDTEFTQSANHCQQTEGSEKCTSNIAVISGNDSEQQKYGDKTKPYECDFFFCRNVIPIVLGWCHDLKITDILLVIFTLALAYYTRSLDRSTRKLWEAGERQIEAAVKGANAAKTAADVASKTLAITERPLLMLDIRGNPFRPIVQAANMFESVDVSVPDLVVIFKNYGRQPAIVESLSTRLELGEAIPPGALFTHAHFLDYEVVTPQSSTTNQICKSTIINKTLTAYQIKKMRSALFFLWFHGTLQYRDPFGNTYITEFLWQYNMAIDQFLPWHSEKGRNYNT